MTFEYIRKPALSIWLHETKRVRQDDTDIFSASFECDWQNEFQPPNPNRTDHYSVFCSLGDWNTNLTDIIDDARYDNLDYTDDENGAIILRQYTKVMLITSEILTDFQDILSTFRAGKILKKSKLSNEANISRQMLDKNFPPGTVTNLFEFINNVVKHKLNNIHFCNHHLHLYFVDSGTANTHRSTVTISNLSDYTTKSFLFFNKPAKVADSIEIPSLTFIISVIINGYKVLDEEFKKAPRAFGIFSKLYLGTSVK